ncbi:DEAD/DEAH box helicase [Nitritalea halalkaliphila]|uniref:DEAD/DEAH box helicase n=1 Tax=Nitritalea halalkaliphila TaxID=590849 RepID=UPI0006815933|nr:DEAD/DEAH box helicase [Nitritalea halalkaliphila]
MGYPSDGKAAGFDSGGTSYALIFYKEEAQQLTKEEALIRLAEWVVQHGLEHPDSRYRAVRSLLLGAEPQITEALRPQQDTLALAKEWARKLHNSYLLIQGAPGSGKSYMASRMIVDLIKQGKKVGITARSYDVLMNLLEQIWDLRKQEGLSFRVSQKVKDATSSQKWETFHQLKQLTEHLHTSQLIAGFPLLFANLEADQQLDYLFIDDAGQLSLVDVLTYGLSAKNVVLIGDPQHAQPSREVHPAGTEVSALAHVQQGRQTIQAARGIFLASTYRMHPDIWAFDSEQFYARQLQADPGLEPRQLTGRSRWQGSGIRFVPVRHQGNTNVSEEEVDTIRVIVQELMGFGVRQSDSSGKVSGIGFRDIQIIAPYSEQARLLKQALQRFFVGTVDDIPDEEAAVVIYSMTSSSPEDAPGGMEFLYNANRFHLALSRAKILFILVGSPAAFEPRCKSPAQLKLVNPFCRFLEVVEEGSFKRV